MWPSICELISSDIPICAPASFCSDALYKAVLYVAVVETLSFYFWQLSCHSRNTAIREKWERKGEGLIK